jgi:hypothetical protein
VIYVVFTLSHLLLHLVPEQPLHLPAHNKGNSLRGGFGGAFRKLVCVDLRWECAECSLRYTCPYTKVFNPFVPPDAAQFTGNQNIPRPFVVKPPLTTQTTYAAGDPLVFDLVLVGQAVDYLPYFIVAFRELGTSGFGLNRVCVQLARVDSIGADGGPTTVYEASTNLVRPAPPIVLEVAAGEDRPPQPSLSPNEQALRDGPEKMGPQGERSALHSQSKDSETVRAEALEARFLGAHQPPRETKPEQQGCAAHALTLHFLTPTTLKSGSTLEHDGAIVRRPAFHHILKRLRDRVNALATFYGAGPLDLDFKALGEAAEKVEAVDDQTNWIERSRFSHRRDVPHDLSGFAGRVSFRGELAPFLALLRLGEYVHVGKNAVFGNGWFVIEASPPVHS